MGGWLSVLWLLNRYCGWWASLRVLLNQNYRPKCWYYDVWDRTRLVLISGVGLLVMPGTASQLVFVTLVNLVSAAIALKIRPFSHAEESTASTIVQVAILFQSFAAVLLTSGVAANDHYPTALVAVTVVCSQLVVPLFVFHHALRDLYNGLWSLLVTQCRRPGGHASGAHTSGPAVLTSVAGRRSGSAARMLFKRHTAIDEAVEMAVFVHPVRPQSVGVAASSSAPTWVESPRRVRAGAVPVGATGGDGAVSGSSTEAPGAAAGLASPGWAHVTNPIFNFSAN